VGGSSSAALVLLVEGDSQAWSVTGEYAVPASSVDPGKGVLHKAAQRGIQTPNKGTLSTTASRWALYPLDGMYMYLALHSVASVLRFPQPKSAKDQKTNKPPATKTFRPLVQVIIFSLLALIHQFHSAAPKYTTHEDTTSNISRTHPRTYF
jgi:hypothetical protein